MAQIIFNILAGIIFLFFAIIWSTSSWINIVTKTAFYIMFVYAGILVVIYFS